VCRRRETCSAALLNQNYRLTIVLRNAVALRVGETEIQLGFRPTLRCSSLQVRKLRLPEGLNRLEQQKWQDASIVSTN